MRQKEDRQEAIKEIVRTKRVRTQQEISDELVARGLAGGQGTVSRDMAEFGVVKGEGGVYVLKSDVDIQRLAPFVVSCEASGQLVAIKTRCSMSQSLAAAIERADVPGVMCAVASADALLVACVDADAARDVSAFVGRFR